MTTEQTLGLFFDAVMEKTDWPSLLADDMVFISATSPLKQVNGKAAALPGLRRFYSMVSTFVVREVIVEGERACALTRLQSAAAKWRAIFHQRRGGNLHRAERQNHELRDLLRHRAVP